MVTCRKSQNSIFLFAMRAITLVSLMVAMGPVAAVAVPINVYWTARSAATLNKTNVGSGTTSQLTSTNGRLQDVDLDAGTNTLYFADWGNFGGSSGAINRIQTDGSGLGLVLGGGVLGDAVHQLALDQANNRIYFTRAVSYDNREISRVDTSGANYTQLHTGTGFSGTGWFYSGLAVDVANNAIYWGDIGVLTPAPPADGAVNSMTLTGAALTTLVPHVDGKGRGFALDQASQTLFYTAHEPSSPTKGGALYSYDIVNSIETLLISDTDTGYWDIEIDPSTNRIWWTDNGRGQIWSANFDGSNPVVELTGLTDVYGLALETELATVVAVDIKPGSCPNPLNVTSKGVLPIAILGSADLDVHDIDVASIQLAGVDPKRSSIEDVATPMSDGAELTFAQINVITVDITPFVSPGNYSFGPGNTMGMALQTVDQGGDFNITEVTPDVFRAMTAEQLSEYDLIAINNHPDRIAGGLGTVWHDVVGIEAGGRVVLNSHDAPRFKMTVPPGAGWFGSGSPGPGIEPFGTHNLIRQAALGAGGVPGKTGLLIFNDSARFSTVGGSGWDNPQLNLPAAWNITDADQSGGNFAPGGGYTDILLAFETHPLYLGLSDARFGVNSISSFAANIVDSSFHSIFSSYNPDIFTPTEVVINSGIIDPGGYGEEISGNATVTASNGTAITLVRGIEPVVVSCDCTTEGADDYLDLTLKFDTQEIVKSLGDLNHGDILTLELTGVLSDETLIEGADCVVVVGKAKCLHGADINKDGIVNMIDVTLMIENWLQSSIVQD